MLPPSSCIAIYTASLISSHVFPVTPHTATSAIHHSNYTLGLCGSVNLHVHRDLGAQSLHANHVQEKLDLWNTFLMLYLLAPVTTRTAL